MSGKSGAPSFKTEDSISSFSASSVGSESNDYLTKYQIEQEKKRKLQDKIAGYKTVVYQIPKLQETITELKRKGEESKKELTQYKVKDEEQQRKIQQLENLVQNLQKQGLTDLSTCQARESSTSQSHSSPSFEIVGKCPESSGAEKDIQNLQLKTSSPPQTGAIGIAGDQSLNNSHEKIKSTSQQKAQPVSPSPSQGLLQQPVTFEKARTSNIVGPPLGLFRGCSTNIPTAEHNFHESALNQPNSYPTAKGGVVTIWAYAGASKKPIWQMEHEASLKKSDSSETAQQSPPANTTLEQSQGNSSAQSSSINHATSSTTLEDFMQAGIIDTSTRPKEWKPLNTLSSPNKTQNGMTISNPDDYIAAQPGTKSLYKSYERSRFELGGGAFVSSSRQDPSFNLNNFNMAAGKMKVKLLETSLLTEDEDSDDLMKFPSLNTNSPSPEQGKNAATSGPVYGQQNGAVGSPTNEQTPLANQAESMASILGKNDSPLGMSDMLYKFAENAKRMEAKLKEYKILIQQQQMQISQNRSFPNLGQAEENARLREENLTLKGENDTLLEFIGALRENKASEAEHGWVSVFPFQNATDPVRAHYPDSPMMKKIESLSNINAKLFRANKDWHNRWETLLQHTQEEKADLEARGKGLESVTTHLKENITRLERDLQIQTASAQDLLKANEKLEERASAFQKVNEALTAELSRLKMTMNDMSRGKTIMEAELARLKDFHKNRADTQQSGNKELQADISLLKQQLAVFAEDFEKERKDRLLAESKAEKLRKERDQIRLSLENKLKKANAQLKTQENDIRTKARQIADLVYQVDDLKLKLQHEQRKLALTVQNQYSYQPPPASYQGPMSVPYNSGPITNPSGSVSHLFAHSSHTSGGASRHSSPEHLPGAWKCKHCTYINYPNRTVCDICGYTNSNGESLPIAESESGRNELHSRGEERRLKVMDYGDVVVDTRE